MTFIEDKDVVSSLRGGNVLSLNGFGKGSANGGLDPLNRIGFGVGISNVRLGLWLHGC